MGIQIHSEVRPTDRMLLSVILPCYNEKENIPICVALLVIAMNAYKLQCKEVDVTYELIVVDDNSPDGTAEVVKKLIDVIDVPMRLLKRPGKLGLGSAYMDGLKFCRGKYVCIMDVDLSHHPKELPLMLDRMIREDPDIVQGTRYALDGGVVGWPLRRILMSKTANFGAGFLLGVSSSDLTGSYRVYKKSVLEKLISEVVTKGYTFQMEVMARAQTHNMSILEHPICFVDRIYGESKLGPNEVKNFALGVLQLFFAL